jgi:hypothetical protein
MRKIIPNLPRILVGILAAACLILLLVNQSLLNASVQQTRSQQIIEKNFLATQTAFEKQVDSLQGELDKARSARDVYAEQLLNAEARLSCPSREYFKPNYIYDKEMVAALKDYLGKTKAGEVTASKTELVWPGQGFNSRTTIFSLTMASGKQETVHKFIVYHNDQFFATSRVFSIAGQCWLDG